MEEIFVKVKGYDGYEVSNTGKIKSLKTNRLLTPQKNNCGYLYILLTDSNKKVRINLIHRLVFDSFIGITDGLEINHLDEDKENNRLDNLELITHEDNLKKSFLFLSSVIYHLLSSVDFCFSLSYLLH